MEASDYVVRGALGNLLYSSPKHQTALRWTIQNAVEPQNILVKNVAIAWTDVYGYRNAAIEMKSGVNVYFEIGSLATMMNQNNWGIIRFEDIQKSTVLEGYGGKAHIYGFGDTVGGEKAIALRRAKGVVLRDLEISHTAAEAILFDGDGGGGMSAYNDDNILEDLYIHEWAQGPYSALGVLIDGSRNQILNVTIDGMLSGLTRSCLYFGAELAPTRDNIVNGGQFLNSRYDNGIYLNSWNFPVEHNTLKGFRCAGNKAGGHSGLKLRPSSYNTITEFIVENNHHGIEIGTTMPSEGLQGHNGGSHDNYIQGTSQNNDVCGLVLYIDGDGFKIYNNVIDLLLIGNKNQAIWAYNNDGVIENNLLYIIADANRRGIYLEASSINNPIKRNHFIGIIKNSAEYALQVDPGCVDNSFEIVFQNNLGGITDNGVRTRINGVGKETAGAGNPPTSTLWDMGDIVINTSDNTAWIKDIETMKLLISGEPLANFTYMNGKCGLSPETVQFIDKSFVRDGNIVTWNWNFGDGSELPEQNPVHIYSALGNYNVSLIVTANNGKTATVTRIISISEVTATLTGKITNQLGAPVEAANIQLNGYTTTSASDGTYSIAGITLGIYTLTVSAVGYNPKTLTVNLTEAGSHTLNLQLTSPIPCFIATVAYDSPLAPQLNVFRRFRDRCLPNGIIYVYYRIGKYLARWIERRRTVKRYTREVLNLFVELVRNWEA